jgi:succinate dehydrogenase / fumarate reductase iron-sulfur subunit
MSEQLLNLTLHVWRQKSAQEDGHFETYQAKGISTEMSFLEMLDVVNEDLIHNGQEPITMDHDCREGICGTCGLVINGRPHGPKERTTTCQLHMRSFNDGDDITIEPFRAKAFPVIKDLMIDRSAFDRIIASGGYVSAPTGSPQDANALPISKTCADLAMDAAACIGCGACVAACPNASAMLFLSAKVSQLALLPQGQPERLTRVRDMVGQLEAEQFGTCTNFAECEAVCPKSVKLEHIARMNRDFAISGLLRRPPHASVGGV